MNKIIVLTGGPGGGKSTLIKELNQDPSLQGRFVFLPEAISIVGKVGISAKEKLFQRLMFEMQSAMEKALLQTFRYSNQFYFLCHRGSLDPLAYWLMQDWPEKEFYTFTKTCKEEHYKRYLAIIHLVTAADGAENHYLRWPDAHRCEKPEEAIQLDHLLYKVWYKHPNYFRVDNVSKNWQQKLEEAKKILLKLISSDL